MSPFVAVPAPSSTRRYTLLNCHVPRALIEGDAADDEDMNVAALERHGYGPDRDSGPFFSPASMLGLTLAPTVVLVDIEIADGLIARILPARSLDADTSIREDGLPPLARRRSSLSSMEAGLAAMALETTVDLQGGMVWPTLLDMHTHIDKGHTCERSRNHDGSLDGAGMSVESDEAFWSESELRRRMDFALRAAYAHGTCAVRTHLMSAGRQSGLTWPVFSSLRAEWAGRVELQGVALVALTFFRDEAAGAALADCVQRHGGVLGAAVSCTDEGGMTADDLTTGAPGEIDSLLDVMFRLASSRGLDLDFHVDENGNECSVGLRQVAEATLRHEYAGRVVAGHCCSLAAQGPESLRRTLELAARAKITVVALPMVNLWLQDRARAPGGRTPRRRGVTLLHELASAGVNVALASDNTRDQFYEFGDLDMLEVFRESVRIGHLDRPYGAWPGAVCRAPAIAMRLWPRYGALAEGRPADLILFRARYFSELLSRPQLGGDRIVVRAGVAVDAPLPDYRELDDIALQPGTVHRAALHAPGSSGRGWLKPGMAVSPPP